MTQSIFFPADTLLPNMSTDMTKWSVVACDQYTSEPDYWERTAALVGDAPSTLKMILPEIYLAGADEDARISAINETMKKYLSSGVFDEHKNKYIYVERTQNDGMVRHGLMGVVDLEAYDYMPGSQSMIRATEGTVLERIPPRVRVRKNAPLELPHIMLLIDDLDRTVIEPLTSAAKDFSVAYDFPLMQNSGSIRGYFADDAAATRIDNALLALADRDSFEKKYNVIQKGVLLFAVGDGNHSLATAKECFNAVKASMPESEWKNHPARYALVEVVNLHDEALQFEPIHRVVFDVNPDALLAALDKYYSLGDDAEQTFTAVTNSGTQNIGVKNPSANLTVGTLQKFLDAYLSEHGGRVDYVHGDDVVKRLGSEDGNIGFLLPAIKKDELFKTVIRDGALPRKAFSMGHACDKRFYLEARKLSR